MPWRPNTHDVGNWHFALCYSKLGGKCTAIGLLPVVFLKEAMSIHSNPGLPKAVVQHNYSIQVLEGKIDATKQGGAAGSTLGTEVLWQQLL